MWFRMIGDRPVERVAEDTLLTEDNCHQTERSKEPNREHGGMSDGRRSCQPAARAIALKKQIDSEWHGCNRRRLFEEEPRTEKRARRKKLGAHSREARPKRDCPRPCNRKIH